MYAKLLLVFVGVAFAVDTREATHLWEDFKVTYGRQYPANEEATRFENFRLNLEGAEQANKEAEGKAVYGVTQFSDLSPAEFASTYLTLKPRDRSVGIVEPVKIQVAANDSFDWRAKGAVTHVKNQGQCGSCWAFSSTGSIEGTNFLKTGKLVSLSEEQLVQCVKADYPGCQGGLQEDAFKYVVSNGGLDSESDYPYSSGRGKTGKCDTSKEQNKVVTGFKGQKKVGKGNEKEIEAQLPTVGPIAISVDATNLWDKYQSGIMTKCPAAGNNKLNHGVLLVGYGTESGTPYWIIKNSWGASWGENGYLRVERGTNQCGMADDPVIITY